MSKEKKDHCDICRQLREACEAEVREEELDPEQWKASKCAICLRKGYYVHPVSGLPVICANCPRGFRMKLWLEHERTDKHYVPEFGKAA